MILILLIAGGVLEIRNCLEAIFINYCTSNIDDTFLEFDNLSFGKRRFRFFSATSFSRDLFLMSAKQSVVYTLLYLTAAVDAAEIIFA